MCTRNDTACLTWANVNAADGEVKATAEGKLLGVAGVVGPHMLGLNRVAHLAAGRAPGCVELGGTHKVIASWGQPHDLLGGVRDGDDDALVQVRPAHMDHGAQEGRGPACSVILAPQARRVAAQWRVLHTERCLQVPLGGRQHSIVGRGRGRGGDSVLLWPALHLLQRQHHALLAAGPVKDVRTHRPARVGGGQRVERGEARRGEDAARGRVGLEHPSLHWRLHKDL